MGRPGCCSLSKWQLSPQFILLCSQCWIRRETPQPVDLFISFLPSLNDFCAGVNDRLELQVLEEACLPSREDGAVLLGGPVQADVADSWHQPPWGILGCNTKLWLLCLRCVEQLLFLCSCQFVCFSFEGNCWEINFFKAGENCPLVSLHFVLPMTRVAQLWGWTGGFSWVKDQGV